MNIHEYQAKALFASNNIPVLQSTVIHLGEDVHEKCKSFQGKAWVVKAQVHAGGRGRAGGVSIVRDSSQLESTILSMLGQTLITKQTGEAGLPVNCVLLEEVIEIRQEIYLAMLVDRSSKKVTIIASAEGGVDIEQVAQDAPEKIYTHYIHPAAGLQSNQVREIGYALQFNNKQIKQLDKVLRNLYQLFIEKDCCLVEINPLIVNSENNLIALDAKINLDDNALYRHPDLLSLYDETQQISSEVTAKELGLNYIKLDGYIGCIVNGAGLAMATMDLIKHHGGEPANFLDVGGGTSREKVSEAFKLVTSDADVRAIYVNIFGGIVRCDLIAQGILDALNEVSISVPIIVLLQGTNATEGRKLLKNKSVNIIPVDSLIEGAKKVIACVSPA